jgi:hypothetical protein
MNWKYNKKNKMETTLSQKEITNLYYTITKIPDLAIIFNINNEFGFLYNFLDIKKKF